jgi:twitching motility protein PilT
MTDTAFSEEHALAALARERNVPFVRCGPDDVDASAAQLLHRDEALELEALPVRFGPDGKLLVAVADLDVPARLERVAALTNSRVYPALTTRAALHQAIAHFAADGPLAGGGDAPAPVGGASAGVAGAGPSGHERSGGMDLDAVLARLVELGGSDLHLTVGLPPMVRVTGDLIPLDGEPVLQPDDIQDAVYGILRQKQREAFENDLELDTSHAIAGVARFRVNVFRQREAIGSVMRVIPHEIKSIEELGIPPQVNNFAFLPRGFVLVTGPTGSGKSTTLASLIDVINRERLVHIMTVEDPIEFLHQHKRAVVNQRELGMDTHTFAAALKHILRQDPDVILVGEMRDLETIQMALTAAETGHLVFGTLHTQDAPQTIDRVIDVFPPHQQEQIRVMLAGALQGVVSQQLLKTIDGEGRAAAVEVMIATPAIRNLIREGKVHQMYSMLQAGKQHGMVTMDQSLADLVKVGTVAYETALSRCNNVADFNRLCGRA